mgnify:CR=1 FL=1
MQYQSMDKQKTHCDHSLTNKYFDNIEQESSSMPLFISVVSYLTIIGWLVALVMYGNNKSDFVKFHLKQSLGLIITGALLILIPLIGWLLYLLVLLAWTFSIYHVVQGHMSKVPLLGNVYQTHLDFIK